MVTVPADTRAEIARRRLAELAAAFDASLPDPERPDPERPEPGRRRRPRPALRRIRPVHLRFVTVLVVAAAVLLVWWLLAGRPHETAVVPALASADASASALGTSPGTNATPASAPAELVIDVAGAVRRPGIVTLPMGSRVHEAIAAAGGVKGKVDTSGLNLARVLSDGEQVLVGVPPSSAVSGGTPAGAAPAGAVVDLNSADVTALDALPGVGPVTADAIIGWREENGPFRSVDDLLDVKGIGEATLDELRDHVRV